MSNEKPPTVLITGCTDGSIGHNLVLSFARQGYQIFATARRVSAMSSLIAIPNITLLELDVTSPDSIRTAHETVSEFTSGKLDILYNNAGVRFMSMGIDTTYKVAMDTMAVNFSGIVEMVHVFSDLLIASRGKIVFTSSGAGKLPVPTQAMYNASKAALDSYAMTLRIEMQPLGVGVINVITGQISTGADTMGTQALPPLDAKSPYKPIEKALSKFWTSDRPMMDVKKYSDAVVQRVIGKSSPEVIWMGTGFVWWMNFLNLAWLFNVLMAREFGLNKLNMEKV
ncbi:NAD(P)-binding protein [Mollisia scopiformis]|uniref:NAD(P)-binding protein n=1 Tax=Mollisia scopiformis TaxID=149040 RepID=A0A194XRJ9_MOLSC|nr:NAD(P)-binding protein [Mollisia scopiformis]KUJ22818.1 NAD(P)-binding protein [Mollisia scopiformis]